MKELSTEEKAKVYDEAIKVAKSKIKNDKDHVLYEDDIIEIFPELKESENEKIRKWLISQLKIKSDDTNSDLNIMIDKAITWLDNQGDKDKLIKELGAYKVKYTQEVLSNHPYIMNKDDERLRNTTIAFLKDFADKGYENAVECIDWLEKQGECEIDCPQNHRDNNCPNGCIVLEDFNGGEGFYKLHLDYLNKKQVEEVEEMVKIWNEGLNASNENIKACIGMCLTDVNEQRFKDYGTNLRDCLAWLEKQGEKIIPKNVDEAALQYVDTCPVNGEITHDNITEPYWNNHSMINAYKAGWLKKQREQKQETNYPKFTFNDVLALQCCMKTIKITEGCDELHEMLGPLYNKIHNAYLVEKQGEQKPTNIVEPKFKVGDWITNGVTKPVQISSMEDDMYYTHNGTIGGDIESMDKDYHLWTIADAKDGDILIDKSNNRECPFIFKETKPSDIKTDILNPLTILGYCGIGGAGFIKGSGWGDTANCTYYPANKEQQNLLFQKMKDAGYEWDADKKELKKIEQKPAWSEEDENLLKISVENLTELKDRFGKDYGRVGDCINWLKSLKGKVQPQPKQEWSVEDRSKVQRICKYLNEAKKYYADITEVRECIDWLRTLKPQSSWKPSDEQIKAVRLARSFVTDDFGENHTLSDVLVELEKQLKKLK